MLAGRAALPLVQQLYRKIFKKARRPRATRADRLQVDFGTAIHEPPAVRHGTFKINQQFVLIGDLGSGVTSRDVEIRNPFPLDETRAVLICLGGISSGALLAQTAVDTHVGREGQGETRGREAAGKRAQGANIEFRGAVALDKELRSQLKEQLTTVEQPG